MSKSKEFPLDVNELLRVLNYLNLGVYVTDLERRIILWNRKAEEITGHRAEDVVGKACHEDILSHVDDAGRKLCTTRLCPLHRAMTVGKESSEPILVYAQKAAGGRVALSVMTAPLVDDAGNVIGGIEAFRDETANIRDLEFARKIQRHLMPTTLPESGDIRFDVRYYPHSLVGGDFYDLRLLEQDRYGLLIADVRGHGVSAALYTMWLRSLEESLIGLAMNAAEFVTALNREMSRFVVAESFATAFYGVVDTERDEISYCNAGHPPPLHFHRSTGEITELDVHGMPLGIVGDEAYEASTVSLEAGDAVLCYTDGITEARIAQGKMLGTAGLARLLREETKQDGAELLERIYRRALEASSEVSFEDDVLLFSVSRKE